MDFNSLKSDWIILSFVHIKGIMSQQKESQPGMKGPGTCGVNHCAQSLHSPGLTLLREKEERKESDSRPLACKVFLGGGI